MFRSICAMFMATWLLLNPAVAVFAQAETTAPVSAVVPDKEKLIADYGARAGDLAISASDKQDAKQLFELILTTLVSINDLEKKNRLSVQAAAEYPGKIEALTQELAVDYKEFVGLDASVANTTLEVEQLIRETQAELSQLHSMIAEAETHDASFEKRNSEIAARHKELAGLRDRLAAEGLLYVGDSPLIRLRQDCNALVLRQYAAEDEKLTSENNEMLAARSYWPKVIVSCDRRVDYLDKKLSALQKRLTKLRRETMENDLKIQAEKDQELLQRWPELGDLVRRNADSYALQLAPR